jgi:hypothetical protein
MDSIKLVPDLCHCIETVARMKHTELSQKLLAGEAGNREIEQQMEILGNFLEKADFRKLRSESEEHLIMGRYVQYIIWLEDNISRYEMHVHS